MRVLDGQPHPAGNPNFDAASTRVDANTLIETRLRAGKLVGTETLVVSPDGKTATATLISLDANGQKFSAVRVYDKQ